MKKTKKINRKFRIRFRGTKDDTLDDGVSAPTKEEAINALKTLYKGDYDNIEIIEVEDLGVDDVQDADEDGKVGIAYFNLENETERN